MRTCQDYHDQDAWNKAYEDMKLKKEECEEIFNIVKGKKLQRVEGTKRN
jgi:hypothetical protein